MKWVGGGRLRIPMKDMTPELPTPQNVQVGPFGWRRKTARSKFRNSYPDVTLFFRALPFFWDRLALEEEQLECALGLSCKFCPNGFPLPPGFRVHLTRPSSLKTVRCLIRASRFHPTLTFVFHDYVYVQTPQH